MTRAARMFTVKIPHGQRAYVEPLIARSGTWHLFLPTGRPGSGAWSLCHLMRRDRCSPPSDDGHGFPFFGLCRRCAATTMWRERLPAYSADRANDKDQP